MNAHYKRAELAHQFAYQVNAFVTPTTVCGAKLIAAMPPEDRPWVRALVEIMHRGEASLGLPLPSGASLHVVRLDDSLGAQ